MLQPKHYFDELLGDSPSSFINIFKETWQEHLKSFPQKYNIGEQFIIGARFRPVILCWGYLLSQHELNIEIKKKISTLALHIELLHKATLLIDDLLDNDETRHGKRAFHIQYSPNEAILFAIYLVGDSFEQLSKSLKRHHLNDVQFDIIRLVSQTIKEMTVGAIQELDLNTEKFTSVKEIRKIIENQTISIIKNGLLTGFKYGGGNPELSHIIDSIGYNCGYIFQLLNDLEPFGNSDMNMKHKGKNNIDILRSRKNLIVAFIYNTLDRRDRYSFSKLLQQDDLDNQVTLEKVLFYYNEYGVFNQILSNLQNVRAKLDEDITELYSKIDDKNLISDFGKFINFILIEAIKRVGDVHYSKLCEILIK
jgi:heptaprenyl diphosphate synthase